jgi:hypothetical protein
VRARQDGSQLRRDGAYLDVVGREQGPLILEQARDQMAEQTAGAAVRTAVAPVGAEGPEHRKRGELARYRAPLQGTVGIVEDSVAGASEGVHDIAFSRIQPVGA